VTGANDVPTLKQTINDMSVLNSVKMALVGLSGFGYFQARKLGGELSSAKAHAEAYKRQRDALMQEIEAHNMRSPASPKASEKPVTKRSAKSSGARWSQADEQRLLELGAHRQGTSWEMISRSFAGRSAASVRSKYAAMTK